MIAPLEENLVSLEFVPELPCEIPGHADGEAPHCTPTAPATYYAELTHTIPWHGRDRTIIPICATQAAWTRLNAEVLARCPGCNLVAPLRQFIRVVGPIGQLPTDK